MSNTIIPTAVLQEVMDAMDDMATDSRLLDMTQSRVHQFDAARDALRAAMEQPDPTPYLWYDPRNGDTWTQEAVDEGFCVTDNLIPLYTNQSNTNGKK